MKDLTIITAQTVEMPKEPYKARHFIDGKPCDSADGRVSDRISPSHGVLVSQASLGGAPEADAAIKAARAAFDDGRWSRLSGKDRAAVLTRVADLIEANQERLAVIETLESGKPIAQARGECGGAADLWRYAASLARAVHGDSHNTLGADILGIVLKEPIGVVSIITPWNFPFWILSQKLPFALAAGCTCVVKPSEMTPSTTAMLAEFLTEAGLPAGVCNIVLGYGDPVGSAICAHGGRGHGDLHRLDRRRQDDHQGRGRDAEEGGAGTGRQEPAGDHARRRSGKCRRCRDLRRLFQRRPVLQFLQPDHRARRHRR